MVRSLEQRLARLEQGLPRWPMAIEEAKQRCLARLKVCIGEACGIPDHPVIVAAQAQLIDDTPEQAEQDRATLRRYAEQHPELMRGSKGVRDRLSAKLDEVARRPEVSHGTIP
jgi:uncharacterized lipoprotein YmbA